MKHSNTKRMRLAYHNLMQNPYRTLWYYYKSPSREKVQAYESCARVCANLNGHKLTVLGANSFNFSVGFLYNEPKTGKECFCYITKECVSFIYISEIEMKQK